MQITFLGTSAGEDYPSLWCHCPYCEYARIHGGKNIRQNSCAVLDDTVILDYSHHIFDSALRYQADITKAPYLFITHKHSDHLYPQHFNWRRGPNLNGEKIDPSLERTVSDMINERGPTHSPLPMLDVYGHQSALNRICGIVGDDLEQLESSHRMRLHSISHGDVIRLPDMTVTAVASIHAEPGETLNYIIERKGKTMLYALDCGGYERESLDIIDTFRFDLVVLECTFGNMITEYEKHQNRAKNFRMLQYFNERGLWKEKPNLVLSHMSPHWVPPHDMYSEEMKQYGITVAYDGMKYDF